MVSSNQWQGDSHEATRNIVLCSTTRANRRGLLSKKALENGANPLTRSRKAAVAIALHAGLHDRQSAEADNAKRKQLISEIERKLTEDVARPIIFYNRFSYC